MFSTKDIFKYESNVEQQQKKKKFYLKCKINSWKLGDIQKVGEKIEQNKH